jgi:hypothetical protein
MNNKWTNLYWAKKKNCVIRVTRPTLFYPADPTTFFFIYLKFFFFLSCRPKRWLSPLRCQPGSTFQTTLGLLPHIRKNIRLPDVFRGIHKLACLGQFSADSKNFFSRRRPQKRSLGWEPRVTFSQITGKGRFKKKKKVKRPTYPIFLAMLP